MGPEPGARRHEHPAVVSGNITSTSQLTHTSDGTRVVNLSLAENTRRLVDVGEWVDGTTTYWEVVCFGPQAENIAASLPCGACAIAVGTFRTRTWRGDDGGERSRLEIVANFGALSEHAPRACAVGPSTRCSATR
jgi:single-strand DNA-binding protein